MESVVYIFRIKSDFSQKYFERVLLQSNQNKSKKSFKELIYIVINLQLMPNQ